MKYFDFRAKRLLPKVFLWQIVSKKARKMWKMQSSKDQSLPRVNQGNMRCQCKFDKKTQCLWQEMVAF